MTVDHLKMLHTAGGKGKVWCLTAGSAALQRSHCERRAFPSIWCAACCRSTCRKSRETLLMLHRELETFFCLTRFAASLAPKHFTLLAPVCSKGERLQVSLAMCQHCEVNRLLATLTTTKTLCFPMFAALTF